MESDTLKTIVSGVVNEIMVYVVTLLAAASVIIFLWGIVKYLFKGSSDEARRKGRKLMLWGMLGLFVIFGIWGILELLTSFYGGKAVIPQFKGSNPFPTPSMDRLGDQDPFRGL